MSNEKFRRALQPQIADAAEAMQAGRLGFIEGARRTVSLALQLDLRDDPDIVVFVAIDSETDALPVGSARTLWNADALANLQPEIDRAEAWARQVGSGACASLVARFGGRKA